MRIIRERWLAALIPLGAVATGEPGPLRTGEAVKNRIDNFIVPSRLNDWQRRPGLEGF